MTDVSTIVDGGALALALALSLTACDLAYCALCQSRNAGEDARLANARVSSAWDALHSHVHSPTSS